jgi:hypothetical protein
LDFIQRNKQFFNSGGTLTFTFYDSCVLNGSNKPGKNFDSTYSKAQELLGQNIGEAERLLRIMKPASTEQAEIIATVFAAWNDLIQAGQKISDDVIVNEVRRNWAATKARFTPERLKIAIKWLKERELVPKGVGPRTLK